MDAKTENRKRMEALGFKVGEDGSFEMSPEAEARMTGQPIPEPVADPAAPAPTPADPATPAPAPAIPAPASAAPAPAAPEADPRSMEDQRQTRRLEGVKDEQRKLSALQTELRGVLDEARQLIATLKTGAPATPAASAAASLAGLDAVSTERLEALKKASPDLYEAMLALTQTQLRGALAEATKPVQDLRQTLTQLQTEQAETEYDKNFNQVLNAVKVVHPDAETIASGAPFQTWVSQLPPMMRELANRAIYQDSANADPATIVHFISTFKKETAPPLAPEQPKPRVAPSPGPSMAAAGAVDPSALLPLSPEEVASFALLKAQVAHDPRALAQLMRRVALTLAPANP